MGTIEDKLNLLLQTKNDIGSALIEKGQTVSEDTPFSEYADKVRAISGGGGTPAEKELVAGRDWIVQKILGGTQVPSLNGIYQLPNYVLAFKSSSSTQYYSEDFINFETFSFKDADGNVVRSSTRTIGDPCINGQHILIPEKISSSTTSKYGYFSEDAGETWRLLTFNTAVSWIGALYLNGVYIVYGNNKTYMYSDDECNTWESINFPSTPGSTISGVAYQGKFVIIGTEVRASADGITWETLTTNRPNVSCYHAIVWKDRLYTLNSDSGNTYSYTDDLTNWTTVTHGVSAAKRFYPGDSVLLTTGSNTSTGETVRILPDGSYTVEEFPYSTAWYLAYGQGVFYGYQQANGGVVNESFDGRLYVDMTGAEPSNSIMLLQDNPMAYSLSDVEVSSISVGLLPNKVVYVAGEQFDPTGLVVLTQLSDGTRRWYSEDDVIVSEEPLEAGQTTVSVKMEAMDVTHSIDVPITVLNS